ncbi:PQ loop repeat-domain-containing protein [Hyaloraphidium curvatum]|nr:PQ loop repeat-domain-containing protein [Hyaloraphidium curvatum]
MRSDDATWSAVSQVLGWSFFLAWSLSFWPQVVLNHRRKSVAGLSFDFVALNLLGFACLTGYTAAFRFSDAVRDEYAKRHGGAPPLVDANDLVFAAHAFLATAVVVLQVIFLDRGGQRVSPWAWAFLGIAGGVLLATSGTVAFADGKLGGTRLEWLDVVYAASTVKLLVTLVKYLPQVVLNYQRRSTAGWSITNIWLDATGGVLSLLQLLLDAAVSGHWEGVVGNPVKLGMSFLSLAFDAFFFVQHYALYGPGKAADEEVGNGIAEDGQPARGGRETDPLLGPRPAVPR